MRVFFKFFTKHKISVKDIIIALIIPIIVGLSTGIPSCIKANKANNIATNISNVTNRPYLLFRDVYFTFGEVKQNEEKKSIKINYDFTIDNAGTLPAFVFSYDIYINGQEKPIHVPFAPIDKPTKNFTIGKIAEERKGFFTVMQKINEEGGQVNRFTEEFTKFALLVIKYKTIGSNLKEPIFNYWALFRFNGNDTQIVKCSIDALTEDSIKKIFLDERTNFSINEAK